MLGMLGRFDDHQALKDAMEVHHQASQIEARNRGSVLWKEIGKAASCLGMLEPSGNEQYLREDLTAFFLELKTFKAEYYIALLQDCIDRPHSRPGPAGPAKPMRDHG